MCRSEAKGGKGASARDLGAAVAGVAFAQGLATVPQPDDLLAFVQAQMYEPVYRSYV